MSLPLSAALPRRLQACLCALLLAASSASQAGLSLSWDLSEWQYRAAPDQTLELRATVYNEASATEHLLGSRFLAGFGEGIEDAYAFLAPTVSLAEQFATLDLAPGQGMDFVFGRLVPVNGRVAPGAYGGGSFSLAFLDARGAEVSWMPEHSLHIDVAERTQGNNLPEPATLLLSAASLGVLALQRRRKTRVMRSAVC